MVRGASVVVTSACTQRYVHTHTHGHVALSRQICMNTALPECKVSGDSCAGGSRIQVATAHIQRKSYECGLCESDSLPAQPCETLHVWAMRAPPSVAAHHHRQGMCWLMLMLLVLKAASTLAKWSACGVSKPRAGAPAASQVSGCRPPLPLNNDTLDAALQACTAAAAGLRSSTATACIRTDGN